MSEIYKPVLNYGNYEISNLGNLRNKKTLRIIKPFLGKNGYLYTRIINNIQKNKKITVHRLVALHFCENPNNHCDIDHKNRNRLDNNFLNLRWCSKSENNKNKLIETKPRKNSKNKIHHINLKNKLFNVRIQKDQTKIDKSFENLEDAIKYRDDKINYLNSII
jgi:hypothetical protein